LRRFAKGAVTWAEAAAQISSLRRLREQLGKEVERLRPGMGRASVAEITQILPPFDELAGDVELHKRWVPVLLRLVALRRLAKERFHGSRKPNVPVVTLLIVGMMLFGSGRRAKAQDEAVRDRVAEAPIHLGIFGVAPTFGITNLGVDTNVFHSTVDPRKDFTFTATPAATLWMRTQRGLLTLDGRVDLVYFAAYANERSANNAGTIRYEYPFTRVRPFVSYATLGTSERPGYEIDTRARRSEGDLRVGAVVPVGSVTTLELARRRQRVTFADDAVYENQLLKQTLDRQLDAWDVRWRQSFTVLTTWVVHAASEQERFDHESRRNSNSLRVSTGVELDLLALVRGSAFVGYRRLTGAGGGTLAEFSGLTANVDVAYTAPTQSRLRLEMNRDLHYSFEIEQPYYVQTGWTFTGTQRVIGRWDVQLTAGRDRLHYRSLDSRESRRDRIGRLGGGIGYDLGDDLRIGFNTLWQTRQSPLSARDYRSFNSGVSLTYGY
jgi:hypothetical protein